MKWLTDLFDLESPETPGEVLFFRIFELFILGSLLWQAWQWASFLSNFEAPLPPTGLGLYADLSWLASTGRWSVALLAVLFVLGIVRRWRPAYLIALVLLHLLYAARFSLGKTPHDTHLLGLTLLGFAVSALIFRDAYAYRRAALGFTYFFVGLSYTLAGISKLVATGPAWMNGLHLKLWIYEKMTEHLALNGTWSTNMLQQGLLEHPAWATWLLGGTLLTELCAFVLWRRPFRRPLLIALVAMHVGIYAVLQISFHFAAAELLLLVLPLDLWLNRLLSILGKTSFRCCGIGIINAPEAPREQKHPSAPNPANRP